jgi:hypothetical protein
MDRKKIIEKIMEKKEFSKLPKKDVELIFLKFDKEDYLDEEKIKLTRDLLRKVYTAFVSQKLLKIKDKEPEWFLKKHLSTKERLPFYEEVYERLFKTFKKKKFSVIDLGAGINGFSYYFFDKLDFKIKYLGVEPVGQLVDLMNSYFNRENIKNFSAIQESLFELERIKKSILKMHVPRIILLFKVLDSLEMVERDYSKKMVRDLVSLGERVVVSFATGSLIKKSKFHANRKWFVDFIRKHFKVLDDFEVGGERYLVFSKR